MVHHLKHPQGPIRRARSSSDRPHENIVYISGLICANVPASKVVISLIFPGED